MLEDYLKQKLPFGAMKHWGFVHGKIIELNRQRIFQQTMVDDQKWSWKPLQNDVNILEKKSPMNLGFGNYEKYEYRNCQLISAFFKGIMIITLIYFDVNWCHLCNGYNGIDHGRANNTGSFDHLSQCIQTNSNPHGLCHLVCLAPVLPSKIPRDWGNRKAFWNQTHGRSRRNTYSELE